jgi:putative transposase
MRHIGASRGIRRARVLEVLTQLVSLHGAPRYLRSDNGPEFVARATLRWLQTAQIETAFIDPGRSASKRGGVTTTRYAPFKPRALDAGGLQSETSSRR